jgi:hypothetical protein
MNRLTRFSFSFLLLFGGAFFLAACNAEPEQTELTEDAMEDMEGPIEEEVQQELGLYDTWDADRDDRLTYTEFEGGYDSDSWWDDWDADDDTYLSEDEFNTAYGDYTWYTPTLYSDWDTDADGLLTEDEWGTGLFDTWDADDDTYLTRDEYDMNDGVFDMGM